MVGEGGVSVVVREPERTVRGAFSDHVAAKLLAHVASEQAWEETLHKPGSLVLLDKWAEEILEELYAGETDPLDPDEM